MDIVTRAALIGVLRDVLKVLGTILAAHGVIKNGGAITPDDWQQIAGLVLVVAPVAYGAYAKYVAARRHQIIGAASVNRSSQSLPATSAKP